jgi:hypothetical protein
MEKVQATVGVYPTQEEAEAKSQQHFDDLLAAGHTVERVDVMPTEVGGEKMWSVRSVYYRKTLDEKRADAAAAAAMVARRSWWRYALGIAPLTLAVGGLIWAGVKGKQRSAPPMYY